MSVCCNHYEFHRNQIANNVDTGISISVETLGEDKDKFLVQVVSHATKEGAKIGSKLVSILDCNLHTLEENRTE